MICTEYLIKSYDFNNNREYHTYSDLNKYLMPEYHNCLIINKKEEMIESCNDGKIRIWNFHSGVLIKTIRVADYYQLKYFCLWDDDYIFVGSVNTIKIVELRTKKVIGDLNGHNRKVAYLTTIDLPKYGKSLISQGLDKDGIKLWTNIENDSL